MVVLKHLVRAIDQAKSTVFALVVFAVITVWMLYPVSIHPGSLINGRPFEDAFEYVWYLDWYKQALFDLRVSPLFQPDIFYPSGWNLGFAAFPPVYPALFAPLTALIGPVTTYNVVVMATTVFAALGAYLLTRAAGGNIYGGLFAGIAFAFFPQREVYLAGHLNFLTGSMWLPWLVLGIVQAEYHPGSRVKWLALAAFAYAMSIAGSWHFLFISTVVVLVFGLVFLWPSIRRLDRAWVSPVGVAMLIFAVTIGPFLLNAYRLRRNLGTNAIFEFEGINSSSVSLERFLVPSAINPLVWDFARQTFPLTNGQDGVVAFGYVVLLLAGLFLLYQRPWSKLTWALLAVIIVGLFLMLGPMLHLRGEVLSVHIPAVSLVGKVAPQLVRPDESVGIPMPALALYLLFPPFRTFHSFSRWGLIAALTVAPLAGLGLTYLLRRADSVYLRSAIAVGLLLVVLVEFNLRPLPAITDISDMRREVDTWLANQPQATVIIEYPIDYAMKGQTLYYTTKHRQKIVHGAGSIFPTTYTEMLPTLNQWPSKETLELLQAIGVRYILVNVYQGDRDFEDKSLPELLSLDQLRLVRRFDDAVGPIRAIYLFELVEVVNGSK